MADGSGENDWKDRTDRPPPSDRGRAGVDEAQSTSDVSQSASAGTPPAAVERVWTPGTVGDWYDAADYTSVAADGSPAPNSYPLPGDKVTIAQGTVALVGSEAMDDGLFNANSVTLGGQGPATLQAQQATLGPSFAIQSAGTAALLATNNAVSTYEGTLTLQPGSATTLGSTSGSTLILGNGFGLAVGQGGANPSAGESLTLTGTIAMDGVGAFQAPAGVTLINDATLSVVGLANGTATSPAADAIQGSIAGTGTIDLGLAADFRTDGAVGSGQTLQFTGPGAELDIGNAGAFQGRIGGFASGDVIGLTGVAYDSTLAASYNAQTATVTVTDGGQTVATLGNVQAQAGPLTVTQDLHGVTSQTPYVSGIDIGYTPSPSDGLNGSYVRPDPQADIQGADLAMRSDIVRATDVVPGTTIPIDGSGIKIGVISTSFDNTGTAAANQAAGFLPAVKVLEDAPGGGDDEGQAMAEEIHQVAPGAQIDFCAADDGNAGYNQQTFAQAVQALQADKCNIIVDDVSMPVGPRYQDAGPADQAVEGAVAANIDYFTSTGNEGQAFLNQAIDAATATVATAGGPQQEQAQIFDNGTPYERFTVPAISSTSSDTLYLQWNSPYLQGGSFSATAAQPLTLQLFDGSGNPVANASPQPIEVSGQNASVEALTLPQSSTSQTYFFAVEQNVTGGTAPTAFNVTLELSGTGTGGGGVIDDPQAGMGSDVAGPKLLPNVNSVGEIFYGESAAFGQQPTANVAGSTYGGDSQIEYAPNGAPLASPQTFGKPDISAPTGTVTTVPGAFSNGFFGTSAAAPNAAAVAALMLQADPALGTGQVTQILEQTAIPFGNANQSGAGLIQADAAVADAIALAVCFAAGTRIRTARGDLAVEDLRIGDLAATSSGERRRIRWLGHRAMDCGRHPRPHEVRPIRIAAHAFGDGRPSRDLRVSPGHSICVDVLGEALIPAASLVNGTTIVQEQTDSVTYWHVELDGGHDVIVAEDLPCESYLDMGNRSFFAEAATTTLQAGPDGFAPFHAGFCRPYHAEGPLVCFVRERLAARARGLGWRLEQAPFAGLHLLVDGHRIDPLTRGLHARFVVAAGAKDMWLVSGASVPAEVGMAPDSRTLGVCIARLVVDDGFGASRTIAADDPRLVVGFHAAEDGPQRWTAGRARLPASLWDERGVSVFLRIELSRPALPRWVAPIPAADTPAQSATRLYR